MRVQVEGNADIEVKHSEMTLIFNNNDKVECEDISLEDFTRKVMAMYRQEQFLKVNDHEKADDALADLLVDVCITDVFEEYETRIKALKERVEELEMDVVCLATEY